VADGVHPQVIDVVRTRAEPFGVDVKVVPDLAKADFAGTDGFIGVIAAYPDTYGTAADLTDVAKRAHAAGGLLVATTDPLALALLKEPAKMGVDIVVGSSGRLGCTLGYGGAHAAFLATSDALKRTMPGRIIGVSRDAAGAQAYRMALGTREQHIRREKATSNICTASALMCQLSAFYCMYHGQEGIRRIAQGIHCRARLLAASLQRAGVAVRPGTFFDTVVVQMPSARAARAVHERARAKGFNLREMAGDRVGISLDETTTDADVGAVIEAVLGSKPRFTCDEVVAALKAAGSDIPRTLAREAPFMTHPLFNKFHSETEMMRYLFGLQVKDIGLNSRMVPLGSCTMKLNAAACMAPITWPEFANMHPFVPLDQAKGYTEMIQGLERVLCDITGFAAASLQPNSGASGEYAGLMTIRNYLKSKNQLHRNVCLLPISAHGTNPASAAMAAWETVIVACDKVGNIDVADFRAKANKYADRLAAVMMTYPSTHGVYEETFRECAAIVHKLGGLVYMDGANLNAQVGLIKPAEIGADVCHMNLHKTFAMPHGGGGPGMGPICCTRELAPFLPGHSIVKGVGGPRMGAVSSAPWGSASLLPISWMYTKMLGSRGLRKATQMAILNANYMAARLKKYYDLVYTGPGGVVAHEFILDLRPFGRVGVEATDVAKRLIDYGFHAPTLSFPVSGTLMIEPTESEPLAELDRFCDSLIAIRGEIAAIERGDLDRVDNPLKNAPHTATEVTADVWTHRYPRKLAAYPLPVVEKDKYWVPVKRVDNPWGDLHLQPKLPRADE
jgi:glycine dehydrogenase